jgi:hypothetical protein
VGGGGNGGRRCWGEEEVGGVGGWGMRKLWTFAALVFKEDVCVCLCLYTERTGPWPTLANTDQTTSGGAWVAGLKSWQSPSHAVCAMHVCVCVCVCVCVFQNGLWMCGCRETEHALCNNVWLHVCVCVCVCVCVPERLVGEWM